MFILISLFCALLTTIIQCQNISVTFPTFPVNTDIGTCTCDLTASQCDLSCCCDTDCSAGDKLVFGCASRDNQYTKSLIEQPDDTSTPVISTVQPTCIKNVSIFQSNSPYIIQKMGELVCVDYERYAGSQYYQQPTIQILDPATFIRAIGTENSVSAPFALPTNLTNYEVGTPIIQYVTSRSAPSNFSLPIKLFKNPLCSGNQLITFMNDFTSTCSQPVTADTCANALNPSTYLNPLCLIQSPSNFFANPTLRCDNTSVTPATFDSSSGNCLNALQTLSITVYYTNPSGIDSVTITQSTIANATSTALFEQTFTVTFIKTGLSSSSTAHNPGYIQGTIIKAAFENVTNNNAISFTELSLLKASSTGLCDATTTRIPVRFGENVRSTCKYSATTTTCPFADLNTYTMPVNTDKFYVAAYANSDPSNITGDWLPVISCTSEIGSTNTIECQDGFLQNQSTADACYIRLDIQIAYTNIGSVFNPQPVLSAVIFYYQRLTISADTLLNPLLITETVTFQDISSAPAIEQGEIPTPNTRLPADFFYPFSTSRATTTIPFSLFSIFLIFILFLLM